MTYDPGERSDYPCDSYTMLIEVDVVKVVDPHVISHVLRGYTAADTQVHAWIRGDDGALDLSAAELSVTVKSYKGRKITSYPASGTAGGEMTCTIPEEFGRLNGAGVYRFDVLDAATGVIAIGILEVV